MSILIFSRLNISTSFHQTNRIISKPTKTPFCSNTNPSFQRINFKKYPSLCAQSIPWEESSLQLTQSEENNTSIFQQGSPTDPIDSEEPPEIPYLDSQSDQNIIELNNPKSEPISIQKQPIFNLKSPMWIFGPLILLITGIVPTLWLPLSSVFVGPTIAGLLSLIGLDCVFNMGAMIFLLMADSCARPNESSFDRIVKQIAPNYRAWNFGASIVGFILPFILLSFSSKGIALLQPKLSFISFLVLVGPYLLLLAIQMLTEMLTWHWRSPVWLVTPVVYEGYRVLQLMRGISLAGEIGSPVWMVQTLRGLVSWWILVLGIQLMRVSWFVGSTCQPKSELE